MRSSQGPGLATLSVAALGVVYGDIGTSPLYAVRECFHGAYGVAATDANVLGVLSLMVWTLIAIVCIKYLGFIVRADNRGEGGVMALTAPLVQRRRVPGQLGVLVAIGLFAACLLYGDGMITPAISVLSAVEGVGVRAPALSGWVQPITIAILVLLFAAQRLGTQRVGLLFGPITAVWLVSIATLGIASVAREPRILAAVNPRYAVDFLAHNSTTGFLVLGAVFLVATGAEALYADMGHFGRRPIRVAWYALVLPALLCSYLGQGALLLRDPTAAHHPFYALAPDWAMVPLIVLATLATIIASQAVISGAFSLTHQAIQLGMLPRMRIVHTSPTAKGQIYIPAVNWLLMGATTALVLAFQTSSQLAAAYGVAVTGTMTISTVLFCVIARRRWQWSWLTLGALGALFLTVDVAFLAANAAKLGHGAWFPLAVAAAMFAVMTTWNKGRTLLARALYESTPPLESLIAGLLPDAVARVPGNAVFMAGEVDTSPPALLHNLAFNKVAHAQVAVLHIATEDVPRTDRQEKVAVEALDHGVWRVTARYGYMEEPNVPHILALAQEQGLPFSARDAAFFLGRERVVPHRHPLMARWREALFSFLSLNALDATRYFHIPPDQVFEIGAQVKM